MQRSPMPPGKPLNRSKMRRTKSKRVRDFDAELDAMRPAVTARSGGWCEVQILGVCLGRATNVHHRKPRGQGGTNDLSNLLDLCGSGTTGCHGYIEHNREAARACGWLVPRGVDPAKVPVTTRRLRS